MAYPKSPPGHANKSDKAFVGDVAANPGDRALAWVWTPVCNSRRNRRNVVPRDWPAGAKPVPELGPSTTSIVREFDPTNLNRARGEFDARASLRAAARPKLPDTADSPEFHRLLTRVGIITQRNILPLAT